MIKHIKNREDFEKEVLNSQNPILVDFFATWCGPCQMLSPILERIGNSRADFDIAKVDIDVGTDLAMEYEIEVVPTLVVFKGGSAIEKSEGVLSENDIITKMAKYMN